MLRSLGRCDPWTHYIMNNNIHTDMSLSKIETLSQVAFGKLLKSNKVYLVCFIILFINYEFR